MYDDITPIAKLIGVGPFKHPEDGQEYFHETAFLYELYPPLAGGGETLVHIVVSCLEEEGDFGAESVAFKTDGQGNLDEDWYREYGAILSLYSVTNPERVLERLGYDLVAIPQGVLD